MGMPRVSFVFVEDGRHRMIGMGHGRTLAAAVDLMPSVQARGTRFVSLLGGLTRRFAASPPAPCES